MIEWTSVEHAPKDGSLFLAKVGDWYSREIRYALLKMSSYGQWVEPSDADQTFHDSDVLAVTFLDPLPVPKEPRR